MASRRQTLCAGVAIAVWVVVSSPFLPEWTGWRSASAEGAEDGAGGSSGSKDGDGDEDGAGKSGGAGKKSAEKKDSDAKESAKKSAEKRNAGEKETEKKDPAKDAGTKKKKKKAPITKDATPQDPDAAYVKDHIEQFLSPTKVEFQKDGKVSLSFDFRAKNEEHNEIFSQTIGDNNKQPFRWTFWEEESVIGGDRGIRLSDKGVAFLEAWFVDDVEAEIEYLQHINYAERHIAAVIFGTPKKVVASNLGTETCFFANGAKGKAAGKPQPVVFNTTAKIKLAVKDGKFSAHRNGARKSEQAYDRKAFASGQIGIIWGGSLAATVPSLTIKGKLDMKKMAEEIRKGLAARGED